MSFKPNFANQPDKPENRQETFDIPDISITGVSNNRGKFRLRNRSPLVSVSQEFDDAMLETNEQIENYVTDSNKVVNRETKKQNSFGSEKSESRRSQMNVQIEEFWTNNYQFICPIVYFFVKMTNFWAIIIILLNLNAFRGNIQVISLFWN